MSKECVNCYTENENSATICKSCGNVFSDSESCAAEKSSSSPVLVMTDMDRKSGKVIKINETCIIGRKGDVEPEFFAQDMYISEYHCKIIFENNGCKIVHLPTATNPTKINDTKLSKGISQSIRNGDFLTIADKTFEISLCDDSVCNDSVCEDAVRNDETQDFSSPATDEAANDEPANAKPQYIITCPKCGSEYEVQDIDDRIKECSNCGEDYDKYEISKIRAKVKYAN